VTGPAGPPISQDQIVRQQLRRYAPARRQPSDHVHGCGQIPSRISEAYAARIDEADTERGLMLNQHVGCREVPMDPVQLCPALIDLAGRGPQLIRGLISP